MEKVGLGSADAVRGSLEADSSTYGPRIFDLGLAEAVERTILAGFEIDVLEIRDPDPILGLSEDALRGRRLALLQAALLEYAAQQNLHQMPPRTPRPSGRGGIGPLRSRAGNGVSPPGRKTAHMIG